MYFPYRADDRIRRTGSRAERTALTFIRIDLVLQQVFTDSRRTLLVNDMGNIFIPEITQCGEHRIWRCLPEGAQRTGLEMITELFQLIQKERMIELAFEGWRLWDLFRWGIAEEKLNEDIYGSPFYVSDQSLMQMKDGQRDPYDRWYVATRAFQPGQEVWPIPLAEKNINPNLR